MRYVAPLARGSGPAMVLVWLAVVGISGGMVYYCLSTGQFHKKLPRRGWYRREQDPLGFWVTVGAYAAAAVVALTKVLGLW